MNQATFEQRVQECLDLHEDPLDCIDVLAFVEQHPQTLDAFVNLRAVGLNPTWPVVVKRSPRLPWKWASLAAAAVLVVSLVLHTPKELQPPKVVDSTPVTLLAKAPTSKLLSLQVTRFTSSSSEEVIHHQSNRSARVLSVSTQTARNIH